MSGHDPPGYYQGSPMNHGGKNAPPPPKQPQVVGGQANTQIPAGYYSGTVPGKNPAGGGGQGSAAAAAGQPNKEQGCFAKCFGCFSGGGTAS